MKQFVILLIGFIIHTNCLACSCEINDRDTLVNRALIYSDLIFCGELIPIDNCDPNQDFVKAYKFKILELFKGDYSKKNINGCVTSMCSIIPQDKGLWIVYAHQVNDSTIEIGKCPPTISLTKILNPPPYLVPGYENKTEEPLNVKIYKLERKVEGLSYWLSDIEKLREYEKEHSIIVKRIDLKDVLVSFFIITNLILIVITIKTRKK